MKTIRTALALACAGAGGAAHADIASDDIKNGAQLTFNTVQISVDGEHFDPIRVATLTKPAGSLTFDIAASAIGLPVAGLSLHLIGTPLGGGKVFFQTANTYSPPVAMPDGSTVSSEFGSFTMQGSSLAGAESGACAGQAQPCTGGTAFRLISGAMAVTGSFGTINVTLDGGSGIGGLTRAKAGKVKAPSVHLGVNGAPELPVCSGPQETRAMMKVVLGSAAPAGGARIDVSTASALRLGPARWMAAGTDVADVEVAIPGGFVGTPTVTAAAGGQSVTTTLDVRPASTCVPPPRRYAIERMGSCVGCTTFGALDNDGDRIVALDGVVSFVHAGTSMPLTKQFGATAASASSINNAGQIAGRLTINGVTQAYRADMLDGAHRPVLLGTMTPLAITQGGTVVGFRDDPNTGKHIAVINRGNGVVDLPLSSSYGVAHARALFMTQDATIIGTYTGNDGVVRGYKFSRGTTTTLPPIAGSWPVPVGVSATGAIAVTAGSLSAVISASGTVTQYGVPSGYSAFTVKDINKWGYAVGTANINNVVRAFVYIPGTGFRALSGYVSTLTYADDALAINDDNQIAIHGVLGSTAADYYLLSL